MEYIMISFTICVGFAASQTDPCQTYLTVNDTTLETDHVLPTERFATCEFFPSTPIPKWYRYTATESGAMANSCPERTACGARQQIWINGNFPRFSVGETTVPVCISTDRGCCEITNEILVKNCYTFYVYNLRRTPKCDARYCFNSSSPYMETTFSIPTTTSYTSVITQSHSPLAYDNATTLAKKTARSVKPRTTKQVSSKEPKTSSSHSFSTSYVAKTSTLPTTKTSSKFTQTTETNLSLTSLLTQSPSFSSDTSKEKTTTTIKPRTSTQVSSTELKTSSSLSFSTSYAAKTSTQAITEKSPEKATETSVSFVSGFYEETTSHEATSPEYDSKETDTEKHEMIVIVAASVSSAVALFIISVCFAILCKRRHTGRRDI